MAAHSRITAVSICSGIEGLGEGVRLVVPNLRVLLYIEREVSAAALLAARMRDGLVDEAPIYSDLAKASGDKEVLGYLREATEGRGIDILFGGPPCQPHSVAGKRLGGDDDRDMFPAALRLIEKLKPGIVFLENVPGSKEYVSERVIPVLHGYGYRVPRPILLEAAAVGASQKRERLFILAVNDQRGRGQPRLRLSERRSRQSIPDGDGTGRAVEPSVLSGGGQRQ